MNPLLINLRHLVGKDLQIKGELEPNELLLNELDDMIHISEPVRFELEIQKMDDGLLVVGRLSACLQCDCVRCLKPFTLAVDLPQFAIQLPLKGEEAVPVSGDFVDLTPYLREDIVLAFPQHPLCDPGCAGLKRQAPPAMDAQSGQESQMASSAWAALNDLKL